MESRKTGETVRLVGLVYDGRIDALEDIVVAVEGPTVTLDTKQTSLTPDTHLRKIQEKSAPTCWFVTTAHGKSGASGGIGD